MSRVSLFFMIFVGAAVASWSHAASFAAVGNLDCNGFSKIQKPLRPQMTCADLKGEYGQSRFYDNGRYIGHDEPSVAFISTRPHSGNSVQWDLTLPVDRPLPAVQSFETSVAYWFAMAVCDTNSYPQGACIPDSDENTPSLAGSAFVELQFYPPGFSPWITQISCDLTRWCAAFNIDSLEADPDFNINPNCPEPVNFAWIQRNGVPTGPPGPDTATVATFTPNAHTLMMNSGDHLRITLTDTPSGLLARVEDLTTGQSGYMVSSGANGFRHTDLVTCAGSNYNFHPEYDTAKYGNWVPWAALQANISFAVEIGHFTPGINGDNDADDAPCFPGPTLPGCLNLAQGGDLDFDGTSYLADWPDGTSHNATSLAIRSVRGGGIGPLSRSEDGYDQPYPIMQFETDVSASEGTCQSNGVGCVVPPVGAKFYPYFSVSGSEPNCTLLFGNVSGSGINNFGRDAQWGASNLPWYFGANTSGPRANPCIPQSGGD